MLCPKCNKAIPDGSRFCLECGSAVSSDSRVEAAQAAARAGSFLGAGPTRVGSASALAGPDASLGARPTIQGTGAPGDRTPAAAASGVALTERYELEAEIGRGGFAVVWRARDRKLGRTVAVKRLLPEAAQGTGGAQTVQRFEREAQAIATLNHRNIVQVFDSDTDADGRYIVMEYVSGGTLREYLKQRGKLPVAEAVALAMGLCRGLAAAHRQGLIHRDVKPANVLLEPAEVGGPVPRLTDFGLSRQGRESDVSGTGYGLGTPYYMAPEQRRDAKSATHTADIYALGKTLYEMVTGEVPDSVDPALVPPPEELARIILKCTRSNPAERYFSAEDLLRDLEALGTGSAAPAASSASGAGAACPSCGRRNPVDARFCEACGTGLMRHCPECDRENAVGVRFCGGCGTDVPAFLQTSEALARMQGFAKGLKWTRVTKEYGLLPRDMRVPGEKGRKLQADVRDVARAAVAAEQTLSEAREALAQAVRARELEQALGLCRRITELDPSDAEAAARAAALEAAVARKALVAQIAAMRLMAEGRRFGVARAAAQEVLAQPETLSAWTDADPLVGRDGVTGTTVRAEAEAVLAAACQAEAAALALVEAGQKALAGQDYRLAMAKADEALATCADVPGAGELRQRVDAELKGLRQLVAEVRARLDAARELVQTGFVKEARAALAALVAQYGEVEVPEDDEVAPDWAAVSEELGALEEELAARERAAAQRQAAERRKRRGLLIVTGTAILLGGLCCWATVAVVRRMAAVRQERLLGLAVKAADEARARQDWEEVVRVGGVAAALGRQLPSRMAGDAAGRLAHVEELISEAEMQLEPALTVLAVIEGRAIEDALVAVTLKPTDGAAPVGNAERSAPLTFQLRQGRAYSLKRGRSYHILVSLPPQDGRPYAGAETTLRADWRGPRTWTAEIRELRLRVPPGFRAATDAGPEPYTNTGWAKEIVHEVTGIEMVYCPAGSFAMGSPPGEEGRHDNELQHLVTLTKGFYLGKYEVTQAQWHKVMGNNPSRFAYVGLNAPIEQVAWEDCQEFCRKLNGGAGGALGASTGFRLPTEAEWEYACRAGTTSRFCFGDDEALLCQYGNYCDRSNTDSVIWQDKARGDGFDKTAPVGSLKPNAWGLHDMHGNVSEWCLDWYGDYPGGTVADPAGPASGAGPVYRGGCWLGIARNCRSAEREMYTPGYGGLLGLRLARTADGP